MTTRWTTLVLAVALVCLCVVPADAQKNGPVKPTGTWTRSIDQFTITFDIQADSLKILLKADNNSMTVHADYGVTKDGGVLFARMGKIERMGIDEGPSEGDLFSFKFKVKDDELTLEDLQGRVNDEAKRIVQGVYKKAKK